VVIAERESGDVTTVLDLRAKAGVDGYPHSPRPETRAKITITSAWTRCGMITQKVC
jgi:hypothetical protein